MSTEVIMPQMGESIFEGTITKWLKAIGDTVEKDEPLFEISTDKVDAEIPSPVAGVLAEIRILEGATVEVNTVVAVIGEAGSTVAAHAPVAKPDTPQVAAPAAGAPVVPPLRWRRVAASAPRRSPAASPRSTASKSAASPAPARAAASARTMCCAPQHNRPPLRRSLPHRRWRRRRRPSWPRCRLISFPSPA